MSKKAKIILGIVLGLVGLFILLFIGAVVLSLAYRSAGVDTESYGRDKSYAPTSSESLFEADDLGASPELAMEAPVSAVDKSLGSEPNSSTTVDVSEKKIIRTGELDMMVEGVDQTVSDLTSMAERAQGFIQSAYVYEGSSGTKRGTVVIKVPVAKFSDIFQEVKDLAQVVVSEQVVGQDVTEEYVDLQARLKNAKAEEAQYLEIMKKATEVEDMLNVSSYLSIVREKIERLQGQLDYLENLTDMSTITVELSEETKIVGGAVQKWKPYQTLKKASKTLLVAWQKTVDRFIWIIIFLVGLIAPIGIIIWLIVRLIRRIARRSSRGASSNIPPQV